MGLKRLLLLVVLGAGMSLGLASSAPAGNFDEQAMGCSGEDPAICPTGTTGQPYSLDLRLLGDEDTGCARASVSSGSLPAGLDITQQFNESKKAVISGTPTQAGRFEFYLNVNYTTCPKPESQDRFVIPILPGAPPKPKLTIGPESAGPGTVGTPYMLAMTANLSDAKTWSIVSGTLPPGVSIGANDGVIAGLPGASGSYAFTVQAAIGDGRSDTKGLTIEVRDRLTITRSGDFEPRIVRTEVGVQLDGGLVAAGGFGAYTWSVEGDLPAGLTLGDDGAITGAPEASGSYRFNVVVTDAEGRRAMYPARMVVAPRLAIKTRLLAPGKVGRFMSRKIVTAGGVGPVTTRLKRGPLPKGIVFDKRAGIFVGSPTKAGAWRVQVEVVDSLGVKATGIVVLVVRK